jgi:hypothetical protein
VLENGAQRIERRHIIDNDEDSMKVVEEAKSFAARIRSMIEEKSKKPQEDKEHI